MNVDVITNILMKTSMMEPFYIISKDYNLAFKQAVTLIIKETNPVVFNLKGKKITLSLAYNRRWGIRIKTKKASRFFSKSDIQKSNLWVESHLIIKIEDTIMIQYMVGSNLHVKFLDIPQEFKQNLLSPCINTV